MTPLTLTDKLARQAKWNTEAWTKRWAAEDEAHKIWPTPIRWHDDHGPDDACTDCIDLRAHVDPQ